MQLPSLATVLGALSVLALAPLARAGMYAAPVVELDATSFPAAMDKEHASLVAFVAPW